MENDVQQRHQLHNRKVDEVQKLLAEIKQNLEEARRELRSAVRVHDHTVQSVPELDPNNSLLVL